MKECLAPGVYVGAAILFGLGVWYFAGRTVTGGRSSSRAG